MSLSLKHIIKRAARENRAEGRRPPVLILLHGVGSNEQDLLALTPKLDPRFTVISVRAPLTRGPGSYAWFPVQFVPGGFVIDPEAAERSRQLILQFTGEAVEEYDLDPHRVYLMGFSQGCIMSLYAALTEPERYAGVAGMSGRLLPEALPKLASPERLRGFPLIVVHGTEDTTIPISYGRDLRDQLSKLPVDLDYREYPIGHWVTDETISDIDAWLKTRLDSPPRALS
jgi:phospholipase/carboxylesterase